MQRVTLIDNYDSFTFNLVHYLGELGADVKVWRNDEISVEDAVAEEPDAIVLSPGPCTPNEAGICLDLVRAASESTPIFGVCLGHQAIGQAFGGDVVRAPLALARQGLAHHPQRPRRVPRPERPLSGDALSFAGHRALDRSGRARGQRRDRRRADHGGRASQPPGLRRAVPSGEHRQRARPRHPAQFPGPGRARFTRAASRAEAAADGILQAPHRQGRRRRDAEPGGGCEPRSTPSCRAKSRPRRWAGF